MKMQIELIKMEIFKYLTEIIASAFAGDSGAFKAIHTIQIDDMDTDASIEYIYDDLKDLHVSVARLAVRMMNALECSNKQALTIEITDDVYARVQVWADLEAEEIYCRIDDCRYFDGMYDTDYSDFSDEEVV